MEDFGVTFYDYLNVIWRRMAPFLLVLIIFPLIVFFLTMGYDPPLYVAKVQVKIEEPTSHQPLFKEIGGTFKEMSSLATQIEIIRSETLAEKVVDRLIEQQYAEARSLGPEQVWPELENPQRASRQLSRKINAEAIPNTKIITIAVEEGSEDKAVRTVNTLAEVYVDYSRERQQERMLSTLNFINDQLEKLRMERIDEERSLWQYKSASRFDTVGASLGRLNNLDTLLVNTMIERQIDEARLEEIKRMLSEQKARMIPEATGYRSPLVDKLREKLAQLGYDRALLLRDFTEQHPEVKQLSEEISRTQEVLAEEIKQLIQSEIPVLDPLSTLRDLYDELIDLQLAIAVSHRREAVLTKTMEHYLEQLDNLADKEIELSRLNYKIQVKKNTYERFLQKKEQVELSMAMETGNVQIVDKARAAMNITGKSRYVTMAWSIIAALIGAIGIAFFLDMNDKRIKNQSEVKRFLNLPLLGMIPRIKLPRRGHLVETVAHYEEGTPYAESFRKLRTQIEFKSIDRPLKTLLCTSTRQEEGKTTLITNLGISFAQKGERVLLVDCDLRRPALHRSLGIRRSPGLSDVLVEEVPWQNVIQKTEIPNLFALTSGERPRNPSELLGSARMKILIDQFAGQFDRVLFDISSVLAVTDSAVMGPLCEGVIMAVKVLDVPRDYILQALDIMESVGANILGVALNGVRISRRSYYYYYYSEQANPNNYHASALSD